MTDQDENKQIELNNDNAHKNNQADAIEKFASGQTAFPSAPNAAKYIATGNGDITQSDLGEVEFEPNSNIDSKPITLQDLLTYIHSDRHQEFLAKLSDKWNETRQKDIGNQDELTS